MKEKRDLNIQVGSRIRSCRERAGMTQEALAQAVDVTTQYISDLERGVSGTSISNFIRICRTLHASADYILFGETAQQGTWYRSLSGKPMTPEKQEKMDAGIRLIRNALSDDE